MANVPSPLLPERGERGVLADPDRWRHSIRRSWQIFDSLLAEVDLEGRTRSRGRRARDLLIPLGAWPDARGIHAMVADARDPAAQPVDQSAMERRLREAHAAAPAAEIVAMVRRSAEHILDWIDSPGATQEAELVGPSPLGPVPVGTMIHASAFQLAVIARDLRPAGAVARPELDGLGVLALVDSSGAVAARMAAEASIAAVTPEVTAGTGVSSESWRTVVAADGDDLGPAVLGSAGLVVDVAAGRIDLIGVARGLRVREGRGLVGMSVVLDGIPDLPAAGVLRRAGSLARFGRL